MQEVVHINLPIVKLLLMIEFLKRLKTSTAPIKGFFNSLCIKIG